VRTRGVTSWKRRRKGGDGGGGRRSAIEGTL